MHAQTQHDIDLDPSPAQRDGYGAVALGDGARGEDARGEDAPNAPAPRRGRLAAAALGAVLLLVAAVGLRRAVAPAVDGPVADDHSEEPLSKRTIRAMDLIISNHQHAFDWRKWRNDMLPFWDEGVVYDTPVYGVFVGLKGWFEGEHLAFNRQFRDVRFTQMLFLGDERRATTTTYAVAKWIGDVHGVAPPALEDEAEAPVVSFRITDFYELDDDGKITYNFMMWDVVDLLRRSGMPVLPPAPLPDEGYVRPPGGMDGVPAPLSMYARPDDAARARALAERALREDWVEKKEGGSDAWRDDMTWYGPAGFGVARGREAYAAGALGPYRAATEDARAEVDQWACEGNFCGVLGTLSFTQVGTWLGEPAPEGGRPGRVRFAFHYRAEGDALAEGYAMFDLPGMFEGWGVDLYARAGGSA